MAERIRTESIDIVEILPKKMPSGQKILWKDLKQDLILIFTDKHGCKGGSRPKPIIIKRFIPISELLFEGLGLFMGDGLKLSEGQFKVFGLSNNQLKLHKHFLKFSKKCFGLPASKFHVRVSVPPELKDKIQRIEEIFSKELDIPLENFNKSRILRTKKPCLKVRFCSILLGTTIQLLIENLRSRLFLDKSSVACFLRGLIAAEGHVNLRDDKSINGIFIAAKKQSNKNLIRRLLRLLEVIPSKDSKDSVVISGLRNFKTMKKWNLCKLHPDKNNHFNLGMSKEKQEIFMKGEARLIILDLLSNSNFKTKKELSKLLRMNVNIVRNNLLILKKKGLVKDVKVIKKRKIWSITEKGLKVLNDDNTIQKLRNRN